MTIILTYHHIDNPPPDSPSPNLYVSPDLFREQLYWLKSNAFQTVSLRHVRDELLKEQTVERKAVVITFDDAGEDIFRNAFPLLQEYNATATVFVITNTIQPTESQSPPQHLTSDQILTMAEYGISFGSHSCSHQRLAALSYQEARREVYDSKKILEDLLHQPCDWFSYPYGNFSFETMELVKQAGYLAAVSAIRDNRNRPKYLFCLNRVMVMNDTTLPRFKYFFSRWYHYRHYFKNRKRWLRYI